MANILLRTAVLLVVSLSLMQLTDAATILKQLRKSAVSGPITPKNVPNAIDARQGGSSIVLTSNITEVQSSYSQPSAFAANISASPPMTLLLPESDGLQNLTTAQTSGTNKTARMYLTGGSGRSALDVHIDQFLHALPKTAREAPLAPQDVGKILFTMYNLQKAVKQARLGTSIMTPLLISQLVPPLEGPATAAWLAGNAGNAAASAVSGGGRNKISPNNDAAAIARQLSVNLNMKEMMPLLAQFLDSSVKEKCGSNSTAAAEAHSDTTALLSMMTQMIQKQEQQQQTVVDKEKEKEKEKKKNPGFMSSEFINEFFTGGNNGVNIQRMMMEIATKVLADVAAKALTGG